MPPRSKKWWNEAQPYDSSVKSWTSGMDQYFWYISHLAAPNPYLVTTPVHIVWNSSQKYKGVSMNDLLKGPDVLNIGDRPAGCIAEVTMRETARLPNFVHDSYVDGLLTSHNDPDRLDKIKAGVEEILKAGVFFPQTMGLVKAKWEARDGNRGSNKETR